MNRLFTLFAALLVGVVASAQNYLWYALNSNSDYILTKYYDFHDGAYWENVPEFNNNGKITKISCEFETADESEAYVLTCVYDEYGNMLSNEESMLDNNNAWILTNSYENNYKDGVLTSYVVKKYDTGVLYSTETHTLTYDANGRIVKDDIDETGDMDRNRVELFEYNSKNIITFSTLYSDTERYTYDENDRLVQVEYGCVENDCDVTIEKITYNADGTEAVGKHYEADGVTLKTNTPDSKYFFTKKTATPSRRTELDHVGAYNFKTVENGQVVIVKDGEKYDLAGRKL